MASTGNIGHSTTVEYDAVGGAFTGDEVAIGQVRDITGPGIELTDVDISNNDSPSGYRESIPGLKDGGEVSLEMIYDETNYALTFGILGTQKDFRITLPDSSYHGFTGHVKAIGNAIPHDDAITYTATVKIDGAVTFTAV